MPTSTGARARTSASSSRRESPCLEGSRSTLRPCARSSTRRASRALSRRRCRRHRPVTSMQSAAAAKTIGEAMRFAPLPDSVRGELASRYEELARATGEERPPVAVRSSAVGEDSEEASHAGQQESFLWVRGIEPGLRRGARLLGEPLLPARHELPGGSRRRARPGDGGDRPADGRRRGLRSDVHVQPGQRRSQHGGLERELRARHRGRQRRGDARRLPGQQGHGRSGTTDGEHEGRRVRAGRARARGGAGGT